MVRFLNVGLGAALLVTPFAYARSDFGKRLLPTNVTRMPVPDPGKTIGLPERPAALFVVSVPCLHRRTDPIIWIYLPGAAS